MPQCDSSLTCGQYNEVDTHYTSKVHCPPRIHSLSRYGTGVQYQIRVMVAVGGQNCWVRSSEDGLIADLIGRLFQRRIAEFPTCKSKKITDNATL